MVVIMKPGFSEEQLASAIHTMEEGGVKVMVSKGSETTILGAEGDPSRIDQEKLSLLPGVERVMRVTEPYKKANRKYHPEDTVIDLGGGTLLGGEKLAVIAGPCSVESEEQIVGVAQAVKQSGASALTLLLPGHGQRRHPPPPRGTGRHRPAHSHRDHVHRQH